MHKWHKKLGLLLVATLLILAGCGSNGSDEKVMKEKVKEVTEKLKLHTQLEFLSLSVTHH